MINKTEPLVSIVIICYNSANTLSEAIESALAQSWSKKEIIVVDDGSDDESTKIARNYGAQIKLISKSNGGIASARNAGYLASKGEFIAWLDSDDRFTRNKIKDQVNVFNNMPYLVAVATDFNTFDENGFIASSYIEEYYSAFKEVKSNFDTIELSFLNNKKAYVGNFSEHIWSGNFLHPGTLLIRREAYQATGLQSPELGSAADYEFILKLAQQGDICLLMEPYLEYRISEFQDSGPKNTVKNLLFVIKCLESLREKEGLFSSSINNRLHKHLFSLYVDIAREIASENKRLAFLYWSKAWKLGRINKIMLITLVKMFTPKFLMILKRKIV